MSARSPLIPQQRRKSGHAGTAAWGQLQTLAVQQVGDERPSQTAGLRPEHAIDKRTLGQMLEIMDHDDLKRLLGPFPVRCPLDAVVLETADCGAYVRETIEYAVEADERVKSFLLVPKHINRSVPAIFAHHQHASQFHLGKSEVVGLKGDADQAYASELAKRGYIVIASDALAFEERNWSNPSGYAEYYELATRLVQGRTLLSKCLHDVSVALDYLVARPEVDPLRIGFIGHSYGGKMAIWAPALDNRIRASVSNCGCVSYKQSLVRDTGVQMDNPLGSGMSLRDLAGSAGYFNQGLRITSLAVESCSA